MRKADRLFQLPRLLGRGRILTGKQLSEQLGTSRCSVYRDVADLIARGVPIDGEAGASCLGCYEVTWHACDCSWRCVQLQQVPIFQVPAVHTRQTARAAPFSSHTNP